MIRKIIKIDEEKCNGCGLCANACHEGAIDIVDGKAKLVREHFCDGFGDCLPNCPTGAITFEEREAPEYDEKAVIAAKAIKAMQNLGGGCPGSAMRQMERDKAADAPGSAQAAGTDEIPSQLTMWPVQIKLAPITAPFFDMADLLIAADCTAYSYGDFHRKFMAGASAVLIGCPKLDQVDYSEKLSQIFAANDIKSIELVRMEVPCCGGMEYAIRRALEAAGKDIPFTVTTIGIDGDIR